MKKYYFLIIVALILGLVLTGCSLLSNISQVPATEQSGITYLTKNGSLPNLVSLWHFDEGVGTIASDSSGNGNTGTLTNMDTATCWVLGKFGNALSFDDINDYVDCGSNVGSFDLSDPFTIEAWINPALNNKNDVIYGNAWAEPGYHVRVTLENKVRFILIQTGSIYKGIDSSVLSAGWHHIATVWDGISVKIYVDGEDDSQIAIENGTVATITTTANTKIGLDTAPAAHYFNGLIDEVRIWNGALTADQIWQSYEALHVDDDWVQWPGAYHTITEALAVAGDGDTIIVHEGIYDEAVIIDNSLTLQGAGSAITMVTGAHTITANDVIIDGFTLDGGITLDDSINPISGGTISNNIITGADNPITKAQNGIRLGLDSGGQGVDHVTIENNTIINNLEKGIRFSNTKIGDKGPQRISYITIRNNEIKDNGSAGIETYGPGFNTITGNTISGNDGNGINLKFDDGDVVTGNTITNNTGPGITLRQVTNTVVENNSVSDHQSEVVIKSCPSVIGGKGSGIHIFDVSENNTIRFNDISGNNYGIFIHSKDDLKPSGNSIAYNSIVGNNDYGILNALVVPPAPVDATYNWWGHPGGPRRPSGNSNQISGPKASDLVSENVLYHPWLSGANSVSNIALNKAATASAIWLSNTATLAVDGDCDTAWNAGVGQTQWIEIDLGKGSTVVGLRLLPDQSSVGFTTHVVSFSNDGDVIEERTFSGVTERKQWLEDWFDAPLHGVKTLRVTTTVSPSWVAWFEIEVYGWQ